MSDLSLSLKKLIQNGNLSDSEAYVLFQHFEAAPPAQQAAALTLLSCQDVTVAELRGALQFFTEQSLVIDYPHEIIDIVGTGGDGFNTFNISTAASMVVASCGVHVAKHGGRASTSQSGSMDVIENLGIPLYESAEEIMTSLDRYYYGYLCGPFFNPLLKRLRPLRRSLGFQTLLNILSPMANPMRPSRLVIGVYRKDLIHKLAQLMLSLGKKHVLIVCSQEGLDEFSVSGQSIVAEVTTTHGIKNYTIIPEEVGLRRAPISEVIGGTPAENAQIIRGIFQGEITDAKLDIVLINAASGLVVAGKVDNLAQGVELAREAIVSGKTNELLNRLNHLNREGSNS